MVFSLSGMGAAGDSGWSRRGLLGAAAGALAWGLARPARAASELPEKVRAIDRGPRGTTLTLELEHGMFPARGARYTDPTALVFVPDHFRAPDDGRVDAVVHFHGHRTTAEEAMKKHQLREQFDDSRQNAILIMPQGPVRRSDSSGGKLDEEGGLSRFLTEVRSTLQRPALREALGAAQLPKAARIGMLCVSAHSGGFGVTARCLKHGGYDVTEVYLFDALYGELAAFADWVIARRDVGAARERHKLICYYGRGAPRQNSGVLMRTLQKAGVEVLHEAREGQLSRAQITKARAVFIRARADHSRLTYQSNALRDCLFASALRRRLASDWFENKDEQRAIEPRR